MDIATLRKSPHLSASSVNEYVECGLLYKFGKIDKIPREFKSDALEFGTAIHLVLAEFYEEKMIGVKMTLKEIHDSFEEHWKKATDGKADIQYAKGKDFKTLLLEGKELLSVWYDKLPDDDFKVLAVEEPFGFILPGLSVPVIGVMDLIEEDEAGTLIITDFKTSGKAYSKDEVDLNQQLTTYQIGAKQNGYSNRQILLRFDCLIKTKTPKFEQYYTTRSRIDEIRLKKKFRTVWEGIQKGIFIPNDTSWKCKNCNFKTACDEWFSRRAA